MQVLDSWRKVRNISLLDISSLWVLERRQLDPGCEGGVPDLPVRGVEGEVDPVWHQVVVLSPRICSTTVHLEERNSMERLLTNTDQITADTRVYDPLLGDDVQIPINLNIDWNFYKK